LFIGFDPPADFALKQVNSTQALLKWTYKFEPLASVYKQLGDQHDIELEHDDIIKNLYFELYLIEKESNVSRTSSGVPKFPKMSAFHTIEAIDCVLDSFENADSSSRVKQTVVNSGQSADVFRAKNGGGRGQLKRNLASSIMQFEFTLADLQPNTVYSLELAARIFNMESFATKPIRFTTRRK
jgi:hypothetical protein